MDLRFRTSSPVRRRIAWSITALGPVISVLALFVRAGQTGAFISLADLPFIISAYAALAIFSWAGLYALVWLYFWKLRGSDNGPE